MRSCLAWSLVLLLSSVSSTQIKQQIYRDISPKQIRSCFRRLNGTTTIGCTSERGGNVGVLLYLDTMADLEMLAEPKFSPYVVLVNPELFSSALLTGLEATGHVTGVILPSVTGGRWEGRVHSGGYSDDTPCPNSDVSLYKNTSDQCTQENAWNPPGSGLMWRAFKFPIFYLPNTTTTESLYTCYQTHNNLTTGLAWPLCSVQLSSNMHAASDSKACIRRSNLMNNLTPQTFCDPLNDVNLHYFVSPRNRTLETGDTKESAPASVLAVTARLDTLTMFDQAELGFDSPSTGLVVLLAAAKMVAEKMTSLSYRDGVENIMFLLLNGEAFDNTGSTRLLFDMEQGEFPRSLDLADTDYLANGTQPTLNITNIRTMIELGQLSNITSSTLYMHTANNPAGVVGQIEKFSRLNNLRTKKTTRSSLPPSSAQTFLSSSPSLHSVFLSNYDTSYTDPVYHSVYDTAQYHGYNHSLGPAQAMVSHLAKVAVVLAQSVISLATEQEVELNTEDVSALINDLLQCYTVTANCSVFHEASSPNQGFPWDGKKIDHPFPQYVGVNPSPHTLLTKQVLQLLTGQKVPLDDQSDDDISTQKSACLAKNSQQTVYSYSFLVGPGCYNGSTVTCGSCYQTTVAQTEAGSPAFLEDVMESYDWASGKYPTWTESIWKKITARSFLQGDPGHDHLVLGVGVSVFLVSMLSVWWVEKNAVLLFPHSGGEYRLGANIDT
eukprot:TRINITY_DN14985_c0_g1_i1.p1 TRINITY_DN14985_c0_g1~~TRINITY_DN14985_c0_g1_i1.p1  ORF type:complete len:720 (+),score=264.67 TRINITY_DN14985_c0_g1_i1:64-2223(+)